MPFRYFCGMEKLWYLRDGDFLPERIDSLCSSWNRSRSEIIKFLSRQGNIFASREEAMEASASVRAALIVHQARQGRLSKIHIEIDTPECSQN